MEPTYVQTPMVDGTTRRFPLGCRFTPSDDFLVAQYLRRCALNLPLPCAIIQDAEIARSNPWDLVPEGEDEKYVFAKKELKGRFGTGVNRAAGEGYWRGSDPEEAVYSTGGRGELVGMKRTLVFYRRNPLNDEQRTRWTMTEYRLAGASLTPRFTLPPCVCPTVVPKKNDAGTSAIRSRRVPVMVNPDNSWVLCRIYQDNTQAAIGWEGNGADMEEATGEQSPATSSATVTSLDDEETRRPSSDE